MVRKKTPSFKSKNSITSIKSITSSESKLDNKNFESADDLEMDDDEAEEDLLVDKDRGFFCSELAVKVLKVCGLLDS